MTGVPLAKVAAPTTKTVCVVVTVRRIAGTSHPWLKFVVNAMPNWDGLLPCVALNVLKDAVSSVGEKDPDPCAKAIEPKTTQSPALRVAVKQF